MYTRNATLTIIELERFGFVNVYDASEATVMKITVASCLNLMVV